MPTPDPAAKRSTSRSSVVAWSARASPRRCRQRGARAADRERRPSPAPSSRASMSAPPRWAMPAAASSTALGVWEAIAPEAGVIRRSMSRMPAASASRGWRRASRASRRSATWCPTGCSARRCGSASQRAPELTLRVPAQLSELAIDAAGVRLAGERAGERPRALPGAPRGRRRRGALAGARRGRHRRATWRTTTQVAMVANVATDQPHADRAFERFTPSGPLARAAARRWRATRSSGPARPEHAGACSPSGTPRYPGRAAERLRLARRALHARGASRRLSAEAHAGRGRRGHAHRADRQRRAGPAPGRGAGLQPRAARCGGAGRGDGTGAGGGRLRPSCCSASPAWRARTARGVIRFTDALVKLFGERAARRRRCCATSGCCCSTWPRRPRARWPASALGFGGPERRAWRAGCRCAHDWTLRVVGGGPVGACAAALLARAVGLEVALLEPHPPGPARSAMRRWNRGSSPCRAPASGC